MLGNFTYHNPTKLYFGRDALKGLSEELPKYGRNVLLVYGGGSIKKNSIYDDVVKILKDCGKNVFEDAGVMPNPTSEKLEEGCERARKAEADLILAVGGGSVCDYAKAVSVSAYCGEDPWEKYFIRFEEPDCRIIPVGCVLTGIFPGLALMPVNSVLLEYGLAPLDVGLSGVLSGPGAWNATGMFVMMALAFLAGYWFVRRFTRLREIDVHACGLPPEIATSRMATSAPVSARMSCWCWCPKATRWPVWTPSRCSA